MNCQNTDSITCPTRDSNILDHCYTAIKDAYHSVPRAALGLSDHCLVHLIPTYRQKSAKPVLRTVKRWTNEAEWDLQACFHLTDWTVFEAAATDLDELTETVTSYISFCEDMCIPTRSHLTYIYMLPASLLLRRSCLLLCALLPVYVQPQIRKSWDSMENANKKRK